MDLLEAIKFRAECKGYGLLCENCPLRISQRFITDYCSGIELGIKASVCNLFELIEELLEQISEESGHEEKIAFFERMLGGKK